MAPRAVRKTVPVPKRTENNSYDGPDSPSKQLNLEASSIGDSLSEIGHDADITSTAARATHLEDAPEFLKQNGTANARDKSSVDILRAAAGRRASKKLVAPKKNYAEEERMVKPKKSGQAAYEIPSDNDDKEEQDDDNEDEDEDDVPELPATPVMTRAAAAKASASPENTERTRGVLAARSPKQTKQRAQFSKDDDKLLLDFVDEGLRMEDIAEQMPRFSQVQLSARSTDLWNARLDRENKAKEEQQMRMRKQMGAAKPASKQTAHAEKAHNRKWTTEEEDALILAWEREDGWDILEKICPGRPFKAIAKRYYMLEVQIKAGQRKRPQAPKAPKRKADSLESPKKRAKSGRGRAGKETAPPARELSQELGDSAQNEPATLPARNPRNTKGSPRAVKETAPTMKEHRRTRSNATVDEDIEAQKTSIPETVQEGGEYDPDAALPSTEGEDDGAELEEVDLLENEDTLALANGGLEGEGDKDHDHAQEDRGGQDPPAAAPAAESPKPPIVPTNLDLFGQREALKKVLIAANAHKKTFKLEFKQRAKNDLPQTEAIRHNKDRLESLFKRLPQTSRVEECREGIDKHLERLGNQLKHIDPDREDKKTGKLSYVRMMNIFVPADVLRILRAAVEAYAAEKPTDDSVEKWYLVTWLAIAEPLAEFYTRSRAWKVYSFVGIKDIRSSLLVPLTKIVSAWRKALKTFNKKFLTQQDADRSKEEARLGKEYDDKFKRLFGLFLHRQNAARSSSAAKGKFTMNWKIKKQHEWLTELGLYDEDAGEGGELETDANGNIIERVEVFEQRKKKPHPHPSSQSTDERPWRDSESVALLSALRDLHGTSHLWRDLFESYCQPWDPLAERTVPEILRHVKTFVDAYPRTVPGADGEEVVEEAPGFLRDVPDLDLIELLL